MQRVQTLFAQYGFYFVQRSGEFFIGVERAIPGAGVQMLGTKTPGDATLADFWIATIQPDFIKALQAAWPDLVAGAAGKFIPSPIELSNINEDILTIGKQRLVRETLEALGNRVEHLGIHRADGDIANPKETKTNADRAGFLVSSRKAGAPRIGAFAPGTLNRLLPPVNLDAGFHALHTAHHVHHFFTEELPPGRLP